MIRYTCYIPLHIHGKLYEQVVFATFDLNVVITIAHCYQHYKM